MSCIKLLLNPNAGCVELSLSSSGFENRLRLLKKFLFSSEEVSQSVTEKQDILSANVLKLEYKIAILAKNQNTCSSKSTLYRGSRFLFATRKQISCLLDSGAPEAT
jgi:hypothetical protein